MICPKCRFEQKDGLAECLKCGAVFTRLEAGGAVCERAHRPQQAESDQTPEGGAWRDLLLPVADDINPVIRATERECKPMDAATDLMVPDNYPKLSVVIPVYNEQESIDRLSQELLSVLKHAEFSWETIFVDDGSSDQSYSKLRKLQANQDGIIIVRLKNHAGKSAALDAGFKAATGKYIATMDADLQNDPRDIPKLLASIGKNDLICGVRRKRKDDWIRSATSYIANAIRKLVLNERIDDMACALKIFKRSAIQNITLYSGMHRFLSSLIQMEGGRITEMTVNHRPRLFGIAKYNIRNRFFWVALDLIAVWWMKKRKLNYQIDPCLRQ